MALITSVLPDVDGDLHTAALHNSKFQTILNELNGNIDLDNLKYPKSFMTLSCRGGISYDIADGGGSAANRNPYGYIEVLAAASSAIQNPPGQFNTANDKFHVLTNSFHEVPDNSSYTIERVNVVTIDRTGTGFYKSGENFTVTLQKSDAVTGVWSTLWTTTTDFNTAGASDIFAEVGSGISPSVTTVAAGNWIRFLLTNPASWSAGTKLAPELTVNVVVKVSHVT